MNLVRGGFDTPMVTLDNTMDDDLLLHTKPNLAYAVHIVRARRCCLAGSTSYLADLRQDQRARTASFAPSGTMTRRRCSIG